MRNLLHGWKGFFMIQQKAEKIKIMGFWKELLLVTNKLQQFFSDLRTLTQLPEQSRYTNDNIFGTLITGLLKEGVHLMGGILVGVQLYFSFLPSTGGFYSTWRRSFPWKQTISKNFTWYHGTVQKLLHGWQALWVRVSQWSVCEFF